MSRNFAPLHPLTFSEYFFLQSSERASTGKSEGKFRRVCEVRLRRGCRASG